MNECKPLDLGNNSLQDAGLKCIAHSLKHNTTLRHLRVAGNEVGGDGAWWVAGAYTRPFFSST